jgi:hypothetical protein
MWLKTDVNKSYFMDSKLNQLLNYPKWNNFKFNHILKNSYIIYNIKLVSLGTLRNFTSPATSIFRAISRNRFIEAARNTTASTNHCSGIKNLGPKNHQKN